MKIYLDIETIPGQSEGLKEEIANSITHPGSMKKPETIAKWEKEQKPQAVEDAWRKTAFKGDQGEIICISWAVENDKPNVVMRDLDGSERDMLETFFAQVMKSIPRGRHQGIEWVGHNIKDFDLRFIFHRVVILGVQPPFQLPHDARPGSEFVYDTMTAWAGWKDRISLDALCKALGIATKGTELGGEEIDGSKVWDFVKAGRVHDVATYCVADVERVRAVYKRMNFITEEADQKAA
ncbi:hypothetical protein [Thiolapillus sp.]